VTIDEPVSREAECDACGGDLRSCINCRHYDTAYHNSCRETEADVVVDKHRRNFCEFFSFTTAPHVAGAQASKRAADARAKLDALFRKPDPDKR
jgi:hypothetical protein